VNIGFEKEEQKNRLVIDTQNLLLLLFNRPFTKILHLTIIRRRRSEQTISLATTPVFPPD